MSVVNDIAITSLETITCFEITTGSYLFSIDELQNTSIANTEEKKDIVGKQGRKLNSIKTNKSVTISGANGLLSGGLMEMQTGSKFTEGDTEIMWADYLTVNSNAATTTYKAIGTTGNEINELYIKNKDGSLGKKFTQNSSASGSGEFAYQPSNKGLTFYASDIEDGTEIVVYYKRKIAASSIENFGDKHSQKCTMYIDAMGEDKCGKVYRVQFYIPKADFSGEFTIDMGDNQTVHNFEAESLAGGCGDSSALWTYTVFGTDTADAE